jgi:chromosome segregation and condensation protein ScpB
MAGRVSREDREAQATVLRAVLLAGNKGLTEAELEQRCEGLNGEQIAAAVDDLRSTGLLRRVGERLHPGGPATHFDRLRPL